MKITIITVGKIKEKYLKDGIDEYLKRLRPYTPLEIVELTPIEIKDENLVEKVLDAEAEKIISHIKPSSFIITMEIEGKQFYSVDFSKKLEQIGNSGVSEIVFIIGSSCGLSKKVRDMSNLKLSLSIAILVSNPVPQPISRILSKSLRSKSENNFSAILF